MAHAVFKLLSLARLRIKLSFTQVSINCFAHNNEIDKKEKMYEDQKSVALAA